MCHKLLVLAAGLRTGAPLWRLVIHDWTKLAPAEFFRYARHVCGPADDPVGFALAWNHHHKANPHHWEYWIPVTAHARSDLPALAPLPMPDWAVREMAADWLAASRHNTGRWPASLADWEWYRENRGRVRLHPASGRLLDMVLEEVIERLR